MKLTPITFVTGAVIPEHKDMINRLRGAINAQQKNNRKRIFSFLERKALAPHSLCRNETCLSTSHRYVAIYRVPARFHKRIYEYHSKNLFDENSPSER